MQRFADSAARVEALIARAGARVWVLEGVPLDADALPAFIDGLAPPDATLGAVVAALVAAEAAALSSAPFVADEAADTAAKPLAAVLQPEMIRAVADQLLQRPPPHSTTTTKRERARPSSAPAPPASLSSEMGALLSSLGAIAAHRLKTTTAQANDVAVETRNRTARVENAGRELAQLRDELNKQRDARSKKVAVAVARAAALQTELDGVQRTSEEEMRGIVTGAAARAKAQSEAHTRTSSDLGGRIAACTAALAAATETHAEAEDAQRKRTARAVADAVEAEREYDAAVGELRATADTARAQIAELTPHLEDLTRYYERVSRMNSVSMLSKYHHRARHSMRIDCFVCTRALFDTIEHSASACTCDRSLSRRSVVCCPLCVTRAGGR